MVAINSFWGAFFLLLIWVPLILAWGFTLVDVFRRPDLSGIAKALWMIFVLILPIIGIIVYFVVRPDVDVIERRAGIPREASPRVGVADELEKLRRLRDDGTLTAQEFEEQKAALLRARAAEGG